MIKELQNKAIYTWTEEGLMWNNFNSFVGGFRCPRFLSRWYESFSSKWYFSNYPSYLSTATDQSALNIASFRKIYVALRFKQESAAWKLCSDWINWKLKKPIKFGTIIDVYNWHLIYYRVAEKPEPSAEVYLNIDLTVKQQISYTYFVASSKRNFSFWIYCNL